MQAEIMTEYLSKSYTSLTGLAPKRKSHDGYEYGAFLDFVEDVFRALNIKNSAESQVISYLKKYSSKKA